VSPHSAGGGGAAAARPAPEDVADLLLSADTEPAVRT
jgi:hypothetical protein